MKRSDRMILLVVPMLAAVAGFWFLVLSPKQKEANELQGEIETLQSSIAQAEDQVAAAEAARDSFSDNYTDLVVMGKAVPEGSEQASLVYEIAELARGDGIAFRDFEVVPGTAGVPEPTPEADGSLTEQTTERVEGAEAEAESAEAAAPPTPVAPATEAGVATLPIGATEGAVGPANLGVMPYDFSFLGNFFDMADFLADLDSTVSTKKGEPVVDGRLMTVNGFSLSRDPIESFPSVEAKFSITTFIVPEGQGVAAGATPAGPAPTGSPADPTPISTTATP